MKLSPKVEIVIKEYISLLNKHLPKTLEGFYLHGSIALDAYVDGSSDIDFITITNRRLTEEDAEALTDIHTKLATNYTKPEMDGVYITKEDVGKLEQHPDDSYPYYNDGQLYFGNYFNFNPITWWQLKENGVSVLGPSIKAYRMDIDTKQLVSYVQENMNSYWINRIQQMERSIDKISKLSTNDIDTEIEWTVLGLLRQFYTLKEIGIISKLGAGKYGLRHMPPKWHPLINEAIHIRKGTKQRELQPSYERITSLIEFSNYLVDCCNNSIFLNK
jgi:predicted nucleotidyltransferase